MCTAGTTAVFQLKSPSSQLAYSHIHPDAGTRATLRLEGFDLTLDLTVDVDGVSAVIVGVRTYILNPKPRDPQPSTLNPQPSTLNPQPSTLNPQP